uniref:Uncharacterized protein n=1 Tax=Grammatophora oceanica TaxID=210454 RepID=A0A7S1Y5J9_9STRA|mmetsp:Transcript_28164/g.41469  ORF Transcript_28164/g.41469 Transcript_28164/m.41469 type:complete len:149 (+) Transcript_28164:813-1259(+)|eukprot:CAMPEP_0194060360 /NCGR_PEP_ID=MMETSP0009_2-20130614/71542_1 /TAXON_ID=210454 /ORGANISM="Grammatophora oceanica, Strain CCMP 410" /LENGTH=148 /DNA_ID=CAMNT_0038711251 /DNA_START=796 /DNA_END=1242 /DNA_ORIENTATION=-
MILVMRRRLTSLEALRSLPLVKISMQHAAEASTTTRSKSFIANLASVRTAARLEQRSPPTLTVSIAWLAVPQSKRIGSELSSAGGGDHSGAKDSAFEHRGSQFANPPLYLSIWRLDSNVFGLTGTNVVCQPQQCVKYSTSDPTTPDFE